MNVGSLPTKFLTYISILFKFFRLYVWVTDSPIGKHRTKFIQLSTNYSDADKYGMNVLWWDFLFYASMGIVITYTVEIAGVLLTFAFLIIPATFSAMFVQQWRHKLLVAWVLGIAVSIAGLAFSYRFDFSCGPSMVSIMGLVLIFAALVKKVLPKHR